MDFLTAILAAIAGVFVVTKTSGTQADDLAALSPAARAARVQAVIRSRDLARMDWRAVWLMADMEQGIQEGLLTTAFRRSNSLFNRHKGRGTVGTANSDGYWTGRTYYVSAADPDLRIYENLEQSVDDFISLMKNPLYFRAFAAARNGDLSGFVGAIAAVPYSAQADYYAALSNRARNLGVA